MSDINDIDDAICVAEAALERLRNRGDYDYARDAGYTVQRGREAFRRLAAEWPRAKSALEDSKRAYDAYVTTPRFEPSDNQEEQSDG